jgi:hypothetical protein
VEASIVVAGRSNNAHSAANPRAEKNIHQITSGTPAGMCDLEIPKLETMS